MKDKLAVVVTLVAGLIFVLASCQTGKSTTPSSPSPTNPTATQSPVQRTIGILNNISGSRLIVTTTAQGQVTVNINAGTVIIKTTSGTIADLKEGQLLTVTGTVDASGNIAANSINIRTPGQGLENRIGGPGNNPNSTPSSPGSSANSGFPGTPGNLLNGTISKINGNTLTLTTAQGQSKVVVGSNTDIQITVNGDASDFQPGQSLVLTGNRDANGEITATSITIQSTAISQTPVSSSNSTALEIMPTTLNDGRVGLSYSQVLVVSGGTPPYHWSIIHGSLPDGLSLNSTTPTITGTPAISGTFDFTIGLTDVVGTSVTAEISVAIGPATIGDSFQLPSGDVGIPYFHQLAGMNDNGYPRNYSWTIPPGSLPDGLSFEKQGATIFGTPATVGRYSFTVQLFGAVDQPQSLILTIEINPLPVISTTSLLGGQVGTFYSQPLIPSDGTIPYIWSIVEGSLPNGLTLDNTASAIIGMPNASGTFNFTLSLTDAVGEVVTQTLSLRIDPAPAGNQEK